MRDTDPMLNFHRPLDGEPISLDSGETVFITKTIRIEEDQPTGMPYDKHAEVEASDGRHYRIWDNGEVDLVYDPNADDGYWTSGDEEERIGSCWALSDRYFAGAGF